MELKRIAIDTSKHVFTPHGVDFQDRVVPRRDLKRAQLEPLFRELLPTEVVLEACGGSHHWGRLLASLGHTVKLIPPRYVKPFVKRGKNDRNDAEAINEAASRPSMRFVPVKTADQQAGIMILKTRELLVRQRTQLINAIRGHAGEFGVIAAQGTARVEALLARVTGDDSLPEAARDMIALLGQQIKDLDIRITALETRMKQAHKANPVGQPLETSAADAFRHIGSLRDPIPGVGPIGALSLALTLDPIPAVTSPPGWG